MGAQALKAYSEDHTQPNQREAVPSTPMQMAYELIHQGADLGAVKEMLALSKELAADQAKRAFSVAISAAKAEITPIVKNRKGHNTKYADFAAIARTIDPIISKHGLSYRYKSKQQDGRIHVTCIIAHVDGYSEENTLEAPADNSGSKNAIQAIGSTLTYLQRYSLIQAFGLAVTDDDDGAAAGAQADAGPITDAQRDELMRLINQAQIEIDIWCQYYKVEAVQALPANLFDQAKKRLHDYINRKKAGTNG